VARSLSGDVAASEPAPIRTRRPDCISQRRSRISQPGGEDLRLPPLAELVAEEPAVVAREDGDPLAEDLGGRDRGASGEQPP